MNTFKKNAAITKYQQVLQSDPSLSKEAITSLMAAEEKDNEPGVRKFPDDEVAEVIGSLVFPAAKEDVDLNAVSNGDPSVSQQNSGGNITPPGNSEGNPALQTQSLEELLQDPNVSDVVKEQIRSLQNAKAQAEGNPALQTQSLEELLQDPNVSDVVKEQIRSLQNAKAQAEVVPKKKRGELLEFLKYKVKPRKKKMIVDGQSKEVILGYELTGECLQRTRIEKHHADILNHQVRNSMVYYFTEGEDGFIDIENLL